MDTDGGIVYIKADYIYKDIVEDVEDKFDTYELDRSLLKKKNEKVLGLMKGELGEKKSRQKLLD